MITRRAILVVLVGFCFYLIALVNVLPSFYYALAWLMAGMLVSSMGLAMMSLSGLRCTWKPRRLLAQEVIDAREADVIAPSLLLEFSNHGTLNKTGVIVEITLRDTVHKSTFKRSYLLEALASGNGIATEIPLLQLPRGEYTVRDIRLIGSDVLGLFRISRLVFRQDQKHHSQKEPPGQEARFVVGPAVLNFPRRGDVPERASSWTGPGSTKWGQHSDEIRGIRAYAPGDDLRDVHWTSTARHGHLVVKEFTRPLEQRMLIVWDGTLDFNRHKEALEWGLRFCASLVAFAQERHIPCSLLCLDASPVLLGGSYGSEPLTFDAAERALARVQANRLSPLTEAMRDYLPAAAYYGQLYLITPHHNYDITQLLAYWRTSGGAADALHIDINAFGGAPPRKSEGDDVRWVWPVAGDASYESASKILTRYIGKYARPVLS